MSAAVDTLFEKFGELADDAEAVARVREVIYHAAITGGLSDSKASDDSIDELESALAIASKKRIRRRNITSCLDTNCETQFPTPAHWRWLPLNRIGSLSGGLTPSKQKSQYWRGTVNWFSSKDIKADELVESELKISTAALKETRLDLYPPGSLVMVARSGILKRTFPVSILRADGTVNQDLKVLVPFVSGMERYLQIMFRGMMRYILSDLVKTGMTVQSLKYEEFEGHAFPLPPLAEQKRIVAKVDALMAQCDRLEEQLRERDTRQAELARAALARFAKAPTPANLNLLFHDSFTLTPADLRKTILTLAVQGKLVERKTSDGTGADILANLQNVAIENENVPAHWSKVELGSVTTLMNSGWSPACDSEPADAGEWGILKTTAVQPLEYQEHQNKRLPKALTPRPENQVEDGDILFTRAGPMNRVGILCVARPTRRRLMISDKIIRFHLVSGIDPDFAVLALNAGESAEVIERLKSGMAASQVNISQPKLRSVPIPIPPLAEQRRIVAKVDQLMALVDEWEARLTATRTTATHLLDALVAELTTN